MVIVVVGDYRVRAHGSFRRRMPFLRARRANPSRRGQRRKNPDQIDLRPHWIPLRREGSYNALVREAMRRRSGVYAVRDPNHPRTILYVGESHSPEGAALRWWKTLLRHFQPGSGTFEARSEWVHKAGGPLDVALWKTPPSAAREVEGQLIAELEPIHARSGFSPANEDVEGVPF